MYQRKEENKYQQMDNKSMLVKTTLGRKIHKPSNFGGLCMS